MNYLKLLIPTIILLLALSCNKQNNPSILDVHLPTVCNPVDLSYQWTINIPNGREAADPTVVLYKGTYYLFASVSGGYWYSNDLAEWTFIETQEIPVNTYAPTVVSIRDTLYFQTSTGGGDWGKIYRSSDPKSGKWELAYELPFYAWDPALFLDDDERLYLYWGCSNREPIFGIELDCNNQFQPIGERVEIMNQNRMEYGWEVRGDYNTTYHQPSAIEGAWVNKYKGKYYLQYAAPGTQFKSYADGVYIADNPLGPYTLAEHNPFAYKPEGFAAGAAHGSTFQDMYGNYWHFGTISISVRQRFERRLCMFPVFFDEDNLMYATTRFGDYPMIVPDKKIESFDEIFPGWMLLSYQKEVTTSSSTGEHPPVDMTDEDIRTFWAAESGNDNEWARIDLGAVYDVHAIQINFAEHNTNGYRRAEGYCHKYVIEGSADNKSWEVLIDKSGNQSDNTHVYEQLKEKASCRYLKLSNIEVPDGNLAISGFRVFGKGDGKTPSPVEGFRVRRDSRERRSITLKWDQSENATGYNIRFGIDENKLYQNYMVYHDNTVTINILNTNQAYYFTIEAFNENGVTACSEVIKAE